MNKTVIVIIVIAILAGGVFFYMKKGNTPSPQTQTPATKTTQTSPTTVQTNPAVSENLITLTSDGYSPTTLTVKAGTTVTWVNNLGDVATVNSAPHPTHTDYKPLNLEKFLNGEKLILTFDKVGTYKYHNHLNPSQKGTVIVQ